MRFLANVYRRAHKAVSLREKMRSMISHLTQVFTLSNRRKYKQTTLFRKYEQENHPLHSLHSFPQRTSLKLKTLISRIEPYKPNLKQGVSCVITFLLISSTL